MITPSYHRLRLIIDLGAGGAGNLGGGANPGIISLAGSLAAIGFDPDNGTLTVTAAGTSGTTILAVDANPDMTLIDIDDSAGTTLGFPVTVVEGGASSASFSNTDSNDSSMQITAAAPRDDQGVITYDDTDFAIIVANFFAVIDMSVEGDVWNSGVYLDVTLEDQDQNLNVGVDEIIAVSDASRTIIPSITIGSPITLSGVNVAGDVITDSDSTDATPADATAVSVDTFSDILRFTPTADQLDAGDTISIDTGVTLQSIVDFMDAEGGNADTIMNMFNYNISSLAGSGTAGIDSFEIVLGDDEDDVASAGLTLVATGTTAFTGTVSLEAIDQTFDTAVLSGGALTDNAFLQIVVGDAITFTAVQFPIAMDFFSYGHTDDGVGAAP